MILGYLGAGALLAGLVLAGFSMLLSFWSGARESAVFVQVGRRAFYAAAAMVGVAAILLETALLTHDFSLAYVAEHSDLSTPIALVAAGFYGGQEGSLLYWTLILALPPTLRDGGMLIHPPVVLAGFASFAIPFAFAAAALLAGRADAGWIRHT